MDQSDKVANYQKLKALALELGFDLFGVGDVTGMRGDFLLEPETRDRFGLAVSLGKGLSDAVLDDIGDHRDLHYPLRRQRQMCIRDSMMLERAATEMRPGRGSSSPPIDRNCLLYTSPSPRD